MSEEGFSSTGPSSSKSLGVIRRRAVTISSEALVRFGALPSGDLPLLVEPAGPGGRPRRVGGVEPAVAGGQAPQTRRRKSSFEASTCVSPSISRRSSRRSSGEPLDYRRALLAAARGRGKRLHLDRLLRPTSRSSCTTSSSYSLSLAAAIFAFPCTVGPAQGGETPIADCRRSSPGSRRTIRRRASPSRVHVRPQLRRRLRPPLAGRRSRPTTAAAVEALLPRQRHPVRVEGRRPAAHPPGPRSGRRHPADRRAGLVQPRHLLPRHHPGAGGRATRCWPSSPRRTCRTTPTTATARRSSPRCSTSCAPPTAPRRSRFPWQQGDVLMLDNMLVAHGRAAL